MKYQKKIVIKNKTLRMLRRNLRAALKQAYLSKIKQLRMLHQTYDDEDILREIKELERAYKHSILQCTSGSNCHSTGLFAGHKHVDPLDLDMAFFPEVGWWYCLKCYKRRKLAHSMFMKVQVREKYEINKHLTLQLENLFHFDDQPYTQLYIDGKKFKQCIRLVLGGLDASNDYDEINSIDEAAEVLKTTTEDYPFEIAPEEEFLGHCSNLQAWFENNYDTRLLHRNIAFPLLKALTDAGDRKARSVFKDEIAKRYASGYETVQKFLVEENYLEYLTDEELSVII